QSYFEIVGLKMTRLILIITVSFACVFLDLRQEHAALAAHTFAASQTAKQKCLNTCRARYRDCRRLKQLPSFECRSVYQDCTRYTCTGLGPGWPACLCQRASDSVTRANEVIE